MAEFLIALPIASMSPGSTFERGEPLPLHCTLMHWFKAPDLNFMNGLLTIVGVGPETIELVAEKSDLFGPDNDVPVSVLCRNADVEMLHTRVFRLLAEQHCTLSELRWVGAGYRPHVSTGTWGDFPPGSRHVVNHLVVVTRDEGGVKRVTDLLPF